MNFGQAYSAMEMGASMRRAIWAPGTHVRLQRPSEGSEMTVPYLYFVGNTAENDAEARMPWTPDQRALAADDWEYLA
jgi:Protein of unknown function (DUF2829)